MPSSVRARKGKGKRWAKGGSSSSNPETKKHRAAARTGFHASGNQGQPQSALTVSALSQFNKDIADSDDEQPIDSRSTGGLSCASLMSCSFDGTVFEQVQQKWNSPHASHREACAVLAAISEVVSSSKTGEVVETEYFAALMTALENTADSDSVAAIAYLLSLIIEKVPENIIKAKFSLASQVFMSAANQHSESGSSAFHRAVVRCLGVLLRAQEAAVWSNSSTQAVFRLLLIYSADARPKVRKGAQEWVVKIMKNEFAGTTQPPFHPGCSSLAKFCSQVLEDSRGTAGSTPSLHVLRLLRDLLGLLPIQSVKSLCEHILRLMTVGDAIMTSQSMHTLHGLFACSPKAATLSAQLNGQLITSLYEYQPHVNDVQPCLAWLAVMQAAHSSLAQLDARLCTSHLQRVCVAAYQFLLSEKNLVRQGAAEFLVLLLRQSASVCVPVMASHLSTAPAGTATQAHRLFKCFEAGLQHRYHAAWDLTLQVLGVAFEVLGKELHSVMAKGIRSLCDHYGIPNFPYKRQLQAAVAAAVSTIGPRIFLEAVPLGFEEQEVMVEFPRAWLLPVFKTAIMNTELEYFTSYFLPLAARLRATATKLTEDSKPLEASLYITLQSQIWDLLPGFCTNATDLKTSFRSIARILGKALQQQDDLVPNICTALRHVVDTASKTDEVKAEVADMAKNFIPILFGLATRGMAENEAAAPRNETYRQAVLDCIRAYSSVAPPQLLKTFGDNICKKLSQEEQPGRVKQALMDLAIALAAHAPPNVISVFFQVGMPHLQNALSAAMQKKAFQLLEVMCAECGEEFINTNVETIQRLLVDSQAVTSAGAKRPRLKCIRHVAGKVTTGGEQFLTALLPEVILSTKEVNEKTRLLGHSVLNEMAKAVQRVTNKSLEDSTEDFLVMMSGGLAGSPHMTSATVNAISKLVVQFRHHVESGLLERLLDLLPTLLMSRHREVVKSTLILVKVLIGVVERDQLREHLQTLITTLLGWSSESQSHFRMKAKIVFERLTRKFGYPDVARYVPAKHAKLITNIRKTAERAKRKKAEKRDAATEGASSKKKSKKDEDDSDDGLFSSDDEGDQTMDMDISDRNSGASTRRKAWIHEGGDDDPLDLLDPSSSRKVLATKPHVPRRQEKAGLPFEVQDGKMVIDDDDDGGQPAMDGEGADSLETSPWGAAKGTKRRRNKDEDMDEDDEDDAVRGGGSGIHRRMPAKRGKDSAPGTSSGKEYRAKKAGGDIKKKDKHDPYAYLPLSFNMLNRRKRAKAAGVYKGLAKAAGKGGATGVKSRAKARR
ncbi:RRP12-like protein [Sycon ciliatum]|uniref:RRP12-like protein n=1 Tax=Sycon ciliatum TaxID=27933 RepID=UPI0031F63347